MCVPLLTALAACLTLPADHAPGDPGPLVSTLCFVHRQGTQEAVKPANDEHVKSRIAKGLKDNILTETEMEGLMDLATFKHFAGEDGRLNAAEIARSVAADTPASRNQLRPAVRAHAELLTTSLDRIDAAHQEAGAKLVDWLAKNYEPGRPLHVTVVCTGNSRRSILGATMGNIAAAFYGMPEVQFHSGGTDPTAFNPRTVAALRTIGVEVEATGKQAPRGESKTENPVYRIKWGETDAMEALEFSRACYALLARFSRSVNL